MINVNDEIEITMSVKYENIPEELTCFDPSDYKRKYSINYFSNNECICGIDFETEAGFSNTFNDNIDEYIKENLLNHWENISEYEIIDIDSSDYEYQTAKIKVKTLK